ncbi:MAG: DUF362 domain-containing protein [Spirochaetaceae bacterium]|nr:MAG: DUF362 domain-containing protein [Spirochaetaceae bacterium]
MNRRDFLRTMAVASFGLAARRLLPLDTGSGAEVGVVRSTNIEAAVKQAVEMVGGIGRYVGRGDVVAVKPNIAFNSPPQYKATTDPLLVRTIVDLCFQAGASKVYVFDRTVSNPKLSYVTSGIQRAAEEAGAKVLYVDDVTSKLYKKISVKDGIYLRDTLVNKHILESDAFINLPVAKQHSTAGLTIGMKNLMGISGDNRSRWHWDIHQAISDINMAVKSDLTVVDATAIMTRRGPTGGSLSYLKDTDTIIASAGVAQADAEATLLFGMKPQDLGYLRLAEEKGLGPIGSYSRKEISL